MLITIMKELRILKPAYIANLVNYLRVKIRCVKALLCYLML